MKNIFLLGLMGILVGSSAYALPGPKAPTIENRTGQTVQFKVSRYRMFAETGFVPNGQSVKAEISREGVERLYEMAAKPGGNSLNITAYDEAGEVVTICNSGFDINEETVPFLDDMTAIVPKGDGWGSAVECPVTRRY